ncbi:cutinase family protein [Candidatus Saccharibacteria bacterium]|nr:cutinase family protein [Candidatus Saccharibacteria bacterium]
MPKKIGLWVATILTINLLVPAVAFREKSVSAISCPDVKMIFARGSGEKRWVDQNYLTFRSELESKLKLTDLEYEFLDLDYPAIDVGNIWTLLTTFVGRGDAYEFGASIDIGAEKLVREIDSASCPDTKFVVAGYSQGAMVISKAAPRLPADRIIYAATFGDPKIYLPEGSGVMPEACRGANLSNYRIYVPDCRVYEGMLGSYRPYQPEALVDKMGTWCNHTDIFCSTHLSIKSHTSYVSDGLYADASKLIFDKIVSAFGIKNSYVSLHDTAILIDSTGSMSGLISQYKNEALNLAKQTFENDGRVALYDYRDVADRYKPRERCNFETCTPENFQAKLNEITVSGGGDTPESLLSAGLKMMQRLDWKYGSTKSVVVLTDASYHSPDLDGTTFDDLVNLSKKIDPVNFYFVVPSGVMGSYQALATATDGKVVSSTSDLSALTSTIISRYDSLPRVEDFDVDTTDLPEITSSDFEKISETSIQIKWNNTGTKTLVALNDFVLGVTEENEIVLNDLDFARKNTVTLVPLNETRRGRGVNLNISSASNVGRGDLVIPKAPNTGRR